MPDTKQKAKQGFLFTLLALLALSVFFLLNFKTVVVRGDSMEPSYAAGARLLSSRAYWLIGPIQKKDVIVIRDPLEPKSYIIKRVLAVGGEVVDFYNAPLDYNLVKGEYRVPAGNLFVVGDNRAASEDSRRFGPIAASTALGKVVHVSASNPSVSALIVMGAALAVMLIWFVARIRTAK
jgi:signal peptidase I